SAAPAATVAVARRSRYNAYAAFSSPDSAARRSVSIPARVVDPSASAGLSGGTHGPKIAASKLVGLALSRGRAGARTRRRGRRLLLGPQERLGRADDAARRAEGRAGRDAG